MKRINKITGLILSMTLVLGLAATFPMAAKAAESQPYTYTIKIILGGTGEEGAKFVGTDSDCITVGGLNYGDEFIFDPKVKVEISPVTTKDEAGNEVYYSKYYVKGMRRSGSNDTVSSSAFTVTQDETYVIAYGVGEVVPYTVRFIDESGNRLLDDATYYGAEGEEVYVPHRYIDGYVSNTDNIHIKALVANQVVDFIYTKNVGKTVYRNSETVNYSTVHGAAEPIYQVIPRQTVENLPVNNNRVQAGDADSEAAVAQTGEAVDDEGDATEITEPEVPLSGRQELTIPDEDVPEALVDIGDEHRYVSYFIIIALMGIVILAIALAGIYKIDKDDKRDN